MGVSLGEMWTRLLLVSLLAGVQAAIKQETFASDDCSSTGTTDKTIILSEYPDDFDHAQLGESVTVHSGKDHGIGVTFACTSTSLYVGETNSFTHDTDFSQRVVTVSLTSPYSRKQRRVLHGACTQTSMGSQRYSCSDEASNLGSAPSELEADMLLLTAATYQMFQPLPYDKR